MAPSNSLWLMAVGVLALGSVMLAVGRTTPSVVEAATTESAGDAGPALAPGELVLAPGAELAPYPMARRDPRPTPVAGAAATLPPARLEMLAPTNVSFVDAVTGQPIRGCEPVAAGAKAEGRSEKIAVPRWIQVDSGASTGLVRRAADGATEYAYPAPWFPWTPCRAASLSDRATSFQVVRPLHREVDVRLRLLERDGSPSVGACLASCGVVGVYTSEPRVDHLGVGVIRLHDVPWLPGQSILLYFQRRTPSNGREEPVDCDPVEEECVATDGDAETIGVEESHPAGPLECTVKLRMPSYPNEALVEDVVLDWRAPPAVWCYHGAGGRFGRGHGCGRDTRPLGDVRVRLLDVRGAPLVGVRVANWGVRGVTDADGVAHVKGVHAGRHSLGILDCGYRFAEPDIDVVADEEASVELRESPAAALVVLVVDADDRPLASASIALKADGFDWFDVDERGVQRLDPFTDAYGRRDCHEVPCGPANVTARWGGRTGEADVLVGEDGRSVVKIVVK